MKYQISNLKFKISNNPTPGLDIAPQFSHYPLNLQDDPKKDLRKEPLFKEIKIVYFGTPEFSAFILEELINFCQSPPSQSISPADDGAKTLNFDIQAVVTSPDKPVGRHQDVQSSQVARTAEKNSIPVLKPAKLGQDFLEDHLSLLQADLFIVVSFGKILPQALLEIPSLGTLNIHGSILPKYRGASPIQAAILNGDPETGVSLMLLDEQMDHGPLLATSKISTDCQDTFQSLSRKMAVLGAELLTKSLPSLVRGKLPAIPQNHSQATYTKIIKKEDGYFDINNPPSSEVLDRMIRAYYPWPGVWTKWKNKVIKFMPPVILSEAKDIYSSAPPQNGKKGYLVQMEGKKPASLRDFLNGYPDFPIKQL